MILVLMVFLGGCFCPQAMRDAAAQPEDSAAVPLSKESIVIYGGKEPVYAQTVGNPIGFKAYSPGRWGVVGATLSNRSSETQTVEAIAYVGGNEELRFSRTVVVPPFTTRSTSIPVHIPPELSEPELVKLYGKIPGDEQLKPLELDYIAKVLPRSGVAWVENLQIDEPTNQAGPNFNYESIIAVKNSVGFDRRLTLFNERLLPATIEGWDMLRSVVLTGKRTSYSPAVRQTMRQWLSEGGRMWILLNQTPPETVRELLGSAVEFEVIDKVLINSYQFDYPQAAKLATPTKVELEDPVELIRIVLESGEVVFTIDGWPALFKVNFGKGAVYITTLESRGWVRGRNSTDPPFSDPQFYTDFVALEPLRELVGILQTDEPSGFYEQEVVAEFTTARIGYEVPSRSFVVTTLLAFCATIGGASFFLGIWQKREYLGWVTIAGGTLAALLIVVPSLKSKREIPPTASSFQVVEMLPQSGQYAASGQLAVFNAEPTEAAMAAEGITRIDPQAAAMSGNIRNLLWSDEVRWRWRNTMVQPGIQLTSYQHAGALSQPMIARVTLGEQGIVGSFAWPIAELGNAKMMDSGLIVFPHASPLAVSIQQDGRFQSGIEDLLAEGQFFNTVLTSEQQRRQQPVIERWYQSYLDSPQAQPMLLAWAEDLGNGIAWPASVRVLDASLLAIPLTIERQEAETTVVIPAPLISMRAIVSGTGQSSIFENAKQQWSYPYTRPSTTRIRFQIPPQSLPLELEQARLEIDCNIPSRKLEIFAVDGDQVRSVAVRSNPSGRIAITLDKQSLPALDRDGGLSLDFDVSDMSGEFEEKTVANSAWSIRKTWLSVTGTYKPNDNP